MRSLRLRLPLLAMGVLAASLAVATVLAYQLLLVAGRAHLDDVLLRERERYEQSLPSIVERLHARGQGDGRTLQAAVQEYLRLAPPTDTYLTIVRLGGRMYTAANGPEELRPLQRSGQIPTGPRSRLATVESPVGPLRSLSAPLSIGGRELASLQVLGPVDPIDARAQRSLRWLALAALFSLASGGAVLFLALRRTLTPLRDLATAARVTELESLTARVPEPVTGDEVGSLAREFNTMLGRLERSAESRREFLATVSHELRTPLTIARGHIETLEAIGMRDPDAVAETAVVVRDELARMGRLVDDLMALARSGTDGFIRRARLELPAFLADLELRLTGLGIGPVRMGEAPDVAIEADGERLAQALLNLVINAAVHTPAGTSVAIVTRLEDGWAVFTVLDDGPGMDGTIRRDAFQAFVTGGEPGAGGSTGLGLAVVRAVAEGHGGDVRLDSGRSGTAVTLRIPAQGAVIAGARELSATAAHRGLNA